MPLAMPFLRVLPRLCRGFARMSICLFFATYQVYLKCIMHVILVCISARTCRKLLFNDIQKELMMKRLDKQMRADTEEQELTIDLSEEP